MFLPPAGLELYAEAKYRSSNIVLEAWNCIESKLIYALGLADNLIISIFIDNDTIILTVSSDFTVVCSVRKSFFVDNVLTTMTDVAITATINFSYSKDNITTYNKSSFYYEKSNKEDEGSIEVECDCSYTLETYNEFKTELLSTIVKELQFSMHRNIFNSNIENCETADFDAKFEIIRIHSKINSVSFKDTILKFFTESKISNKESDQLYDINRRLKNVR